MTNLETLTSTIRLGVFDYLNVAPIYASLPSVMESAGIPETTIREVRGVPSGINAALLAGEVDVANISSMAFADHADELVLMPHLSIAAREKVQSVLLFSWHPDWRALDGKRIALTNQSATSVALTKLLAEKRYGIQPTYVTMTSDLDTMLAECDAALIIGNDAFREFATRREIVGRGQPYVFDLASEWYSWTCLPFVFGVWAARADRAEAVRRAGVLDLLLHSKNDRLGKLDALASQEGARWGLPSAMISTYFQTLRYDLTEEDRDGMRQFFAMVRPELQWDTIRWL